MRPMQYMLVLVLVLLTATVYFVTRPDPEYRVGSTLPDVPIAQEKSTDPAPETADSEEEQRRAAMQAEFEALKTARRNLESRLNRLKVVLYGVALPAEERNTINATMKNGYRLLKNKKLLGAYRSVEEIDEEILKTEFTYQQIVELEQMVREMKKNQQESTR